MCNTILTIIVTQSHQGTLIPFGIHDPLTVSAPQGQLVPDAENHTLRCPVMFGRHVRHLKRQARFGIKGVDRLSQRRRQHCETRGSDTQYRWIILIVFKITTC